MREREKEREREREREREERERECVCVEGRKSRAKSGSCFDASWVFLAP